MPDNRSIAEQLILLSRLMEIHGENPFKARSYALAAYEIEKIKQPLSALTLEQIQQIKGIGEAIGKKIQQILHEGQFPLLEKYLAATPAGVLEMLHIKGLGPKKIRVIWKEMGIESIGELLYACHENRLLHHKGFGPKTQENIIQEIQQYLAHQHKWLFAEIEHTAIDILHQLQTFYPKALYVIVGDFRRQCTVIDRLEILTTADLQTLSTHIPHPQTIEPHRLLVQWPPGIPVYMHHSSPSQWGNNVLFTTGSTTFTEALIKTFPEIMNQHFSTEEEWFRAADIAYIPPCLRDDTRWIKQARLHQIPQLIQIQDIKGIIHAHSQWSDGAHSLEEMAKACIQQGFEYLVICDHSQSAFYANGLSTERVKAQHEEIDKLNEQLYPFRIFKGIEADILPDGRLDYPDEVLEQFDIVIASIHSGLKMTEEKAMQRLLRAIAHPSTTILGHPTGRLLLSRNGYPVDHQAIIDACKTHQVIIEINAHPRRLDIDWQWIPLAIEAKVLLSIDPDAHHLDGYQDIRYGVLAAQKGGLTASHNFSSFSKEEIEAYLKKKKSSWR
ncbi:MAG: PHP domain-containing protein [Thermoflavifilum sp.]|nr:PHP domain-containing protein [Thermoflavifilum sp.]